MTELDPADVKNLLDERAITRELVRFARAMDDRDWDTMAAILADDARADFGTGPLEGRSVVIDLIRSYLENCGATQHLLGNIVVNLSGDDAVTRAYVRDVHLNSGDDPSMRMYTLGDYRDVWRRSVHGSWSLVERVKVNRGFVGTLNVFQGSP